MVSETDYIDALHILQMENNDKLMVGKSQEGQRMNEYKTHRIWAEKMLILSEIYGVVKNE